MVVRVGVCTSARQYNIEELLSKLRSSLPTITIQMVSLPYNDLDSYRVERQLEELDGLILCHSINNRRFAITDVKDALYDKFLPRAKRYLGKENVVVIAHDFSWPFEKNAAMVSFRKDQPTAVDCSSLVILCGKLQDKTVQMDEDDWYQLVAWTGAVQPIKSHYHDNEVPKPLNELTRLAFDGLQFTVRSILYYMGASIFTILGAVLILFWRKDKKPTGKVGNLDSVQSYKPPDKKEERWS